MSNPERFDVVVIGGGQSGLSVGHHLSRLGIEHVILDARDRVGDAWRQRWDSLHLFTPARWDGLDGMPFPGDPYRFPSKDEMADYLEAYATRFKLPVRTGMKVDRLARNGSGYEVSASGRRFEAPHVVVAMSSYQSPRVPAFASQLEIAQLHSAEYRNPAQLPPGGVLVVGAGNSGAEIAMDLRQAGRPVWVSGRDVGQVPFSVRHMFVRRVIAPVLFRVVFHRVLTVDTPIGRRVRPKFLAGGRPLIRTLAGDMKAGGVERVARVEGARDGKPLLADGRVLDAKSVVWCTGFDLGSSWIEFKVFDEHGDPVQSRGVVLGEPGLYFVGTEFLYSPSSAMVHGVGRDAKRVAETIQGRLGDAS